MPPKKAVPIIRYSLDELPSRTFWKVSVSLPRGEAGTFVEQLHSIASERGGASFYYPDIDHDRTLCRYEWHRPLGKDKYGLRLGIVVDVGRADITEVEAYVTRSAVFEDMSKPMEALAGEIVEEAQEEVFATLTEAARRQQPQEDREFIVVYHVEVPYQYGFDKRFTTSDGLLNFVPTRILKDGNRRASAVLIRSRASTKEIAKARAFREITVACALFTLANNQRYETTTLSWSRSRQPLQFLESVDNTNEGRLYSGRRIWPKLEKIDPGAAERCDWAWSAFDKVSADERALFLPALFAYYASTVRKKDLSTLSVVGFVAALAALGAGRRVSCDGSLTCSRCGPIPLKHDLTSEVSAICTTVAETCGITNPALVSELRDMLQRVHRKQRSAFVHGAQLRHEEYGTGGGFPPHMPTNDAPVQEQFEYAQDLTSISVVTRRTLLEWLASRAGMKLDHELFFINTDRVTAKLLHAMQVTSPGPSVIGFAAPSQPLVRPKLA